MTSKQGPRYSETKTTPIEDLGGGLQRQMLGYNDELMAVKIWFAPGAEGYTHSHRHSQASLVVEGEFHVTIEGELKILGPGDSFFVAPFEEHGAVCPTGGVLIDTFSPAREDFLKDN
jgi:quercetin dioxygenase-like cupin family protein